MEFLNNIEFEDDDSQKVINEIIEKASKYDIYDFIARVSGLNIFSKNQNKAVLLDTLTQHVFVKKKEYYTSLIKMSDKKFKSFIEELNNTFLAASIDPCENTFVQNVMFNQSNYRVFNGIDITPAYNLQSMIRILFGYQNEFPTEYLDKVNKLFALILGISEEIAQKIDSRLDNAEYDESRRIIIPSGETVRSYANYVSIPLTKVQSFIDNYFSLDEICIAFGNDSVGRIDYRPFYTRPFLKNEDHNVLIVLNVALLPTFAFYKAIEWAEVYGIKREVINRYNDYIWLETRITLENMGHSPINVRAYNVECKDEEYYKESVVTVYNNQLMFVIYLCDDGADYKEKTIHNQYPDARHQTILQDRMIYFRDSLSRMGIYAEDTYLLIILNGIGRGIFAGLKEFYFGYKPITLNSFELHCVGIHEHDNLPFLPRYMRAKSMLNIGMQSNMFSEINAICIYTSNHNSFYMNDNVDTDETSIYIAPGDSIEYISEALIRENRILMNSYEDGSMAEVKLVDKERNIYSEDMLFPRKHVAFCIPYENIKLWIVTDEIADFKQLDEFNVFASLVDAISYWLAECKSIIERYDFPYKTYTIHMSICGEIDAFYYEQENSVPFEDCIDQSIEKNHIYLTFRPESYRNMQYNDNSQEKGLLQYIIDILDDISYAKRNYYDELELVFNNPLKKRFVATHYDQKPYLVPLKYETHRTVHGEDEDYLSEKLGKELLESGEWEIGVVGEAKRGIIAKVVVDWLYRRLESMVAEFEPTNMLEIIYHDLEETLSKLIMAEERYYSNTACYPEREGLYLSTYNDLNRTSLALKFLIEYVTARPSSGTKHFGIGQYEELLAICSMVVEWAHKGDLFVYNIVNTPVEFLKSKRIGMSHEEIADINMYGMDYRRRQLLYDSSGSLRKEYQVVVKNFSAELETAFLSEFGYSYSDFCNVVATMVSLCEGDIICIPEAELSSKLIELNNALTEELIKKVIDDITYCAREDYLRMPKGFDKEDAYPWRFNRKYSFNRRPVLVRDDSLLWGKRQLYHMGEYLLDLIYTGRIKAKSKEMDALCGKIAKETGKVFNDLIVQIIQDMNEFAIYPNRKKINGIRISENGEDLGDIDILIIDEKTSKIISTEVKNFRFSRNPREIRMEYEKLFVDKEGKPCFATKHKRRTRWIEAHLSDVKQEFNLDDREWKVVSLFIANQSLISQHIYKQNIKCISKAELCVEAIRSV